MRSTTPLQSCGRTATSRLAAAQQRGGALVYASAELQADREVVLAAVQQDGHALQYATAELQADREGVLAAVQQDGRDFGGKGYGVGPTWAPPASAMSYHLPSYAKGGREVGPRFTP